MGKNYLIKNYGIRVIIYSVIIMMGIGAMTGAVYSAPGSPGDTAADRIMGQTDFISNTANNGGVSAGSFLIKQIAKIHRDFH